MRTLDGFLDVGHSGIAESILPFAQGISAGAGSKNVAEKTSFGFGKDAKGINCNFSNQMKGNSINPLHYPSKKDELQYFFKHELKGTTMKSWWPGRTTSGECNNLNDKKRGCWYRVKLLDDPSCNLDHHCLHVLPHDGEPLYTYTCPGWLMNHDGMPCAIPEHFQACPKRFHTQRNESGIPLQFLQAIRTPCDGKQDHCVGSTATEDTKEIGMYLDIKNNRWYRCTPWFKCEDLPVQSIDDPADLGGKCGKEECARGETCFTAKSGRSFCHNEDHIFVVPCGDTASDHEIENQLWEGFGKQQDANLEGHPEGGLGQEGTQPPGELGQEGMPVNGQAGFQGQGYGYLEGHGGKPGEADPEGPPPVDMPPLREHGVTDNYVTEEMGYGDNGIGRKEMPSICLIWASLPALPTWQAASKAPVSVAVKSRPSKIWRSDDFL